MSVPERLTLLNKEMKQMTALHSRETPNIILKALLPFCPISNIPHASCEAPCEAHDAHAYTK